MPDSQAGDGCLQKQRFVTASGQANAYEDALEVLPQYRVERAQRIANLRFGVGSDDQADDGAWMRTIAISP